MNTFDIVYNLRTPGVVLTAHIDTKLVSKRVFNAAHRMVGTLAFKGGYRSQAKQLANVLAHRHDLPTAAHSYSSVRIYRSGKLPPKVIDEIDQLLDADAMIEIGIRPPGGHSDYIRDQANRSKDRLRVIGGGGRYSYLAVSNDDMQKEIVGVLAKHWLSDPGIAQRRDAAVRELTSGEPIPFNPYTNYD